jgi:hypothetical protein
MDDAKQQEAMKKMQRQLRDAEEQVAELERKEAEASQRKSDLVSSSSFQNLAPSVYFALSQERKVLSLEAEFEQSQSDLKLAFKRISDLQAVIEDDLHEDSSDDASDYNEFSDTDDESDSDIEQLNHRNRSYVRATGGSMSSSVDGGRYSVSDGNDSSR